MTQSAKEFRQNEWSAELAEDARQLIRLALQEDLGALGDLTTRALISPQLSGRAAVVAREAGRVCGLPLGPLIFEALEPVDWQPCVAEGSEVERDTCLARLAGPATALLTGERLLLNLLGRLSGIATRTRRFADAVAGTGARIYDTRKTTPGWRRLEKYAVRCGGGHNHRTGLYDSVLIKDNHLAWYAPAVGSIADAVRRAQEYVRDHPDLDTRTTLIEVEVDSLFQFDEILPTRPDIILLDNMSLAELREAVRRRNDSGLPVQLEASGGMTLETVRAVAETGVERISVGSLTHGAVSQDVALDWITG